MNIKRIFVALSLLLLASCSSDKPRIEPAKLLDLKPSATIDVRWSADIGGAGQSVLFPAVTREAVFAANSSGRLYRLDRNNGKKLWGIDSGFAITGGVGAGEGLVLVGGEKGQLAAFDESDGKLKWQVDVRSDVLSAPEIADGVVVVRTGNQRITGLSAKDGSRLWLYERATPTLIVRSHAGVAIRNGLVYAGFAAGKLAAISLKNGAVVWESAVSQPRGNTELERISDITSLPVVDNSRVCAVAFQGRLACFDPARGGALWTRDVSSDKGLSLYGKTLYLTDTDSKVLALDVAGGASLWKNDQLLARAATAPYPLGDHLLLGDFEGYLHMLKSEDGSIVARRGTDGTAIRIAPMTLGDGALVMTSGGELFSVSVR
ncbi:MAG: outer membrane protein assembly factor BamB [Gammaproteobacteria bacterium]|nr:outer membrane protein assembly factor BamB [Gammaproteobacteria bacterium]MBU1775967.1 outer membrane protein assembly factor BamB [Gammaproteobacteria bacterium]MBU1967768.1 outer membrane protein assembly factor BamB [Gammaproteobacteria bacterium]